MHWCIAERAYQMSGLFGYIALNPRHPPCDVVEQMADVLRHRPWIAAEHAAPAPGLAFGRLHIGIFNRSPQPVSSPDGTVWLLFSGELYHQAARRAALERRGMLDTGGGDAALALAVYLHDGADGLCSLEGAFVAAVWDEREHELLLINDRWGLYPHYWSHTARGFAWAPEIKALLCAPGVGRDVDKVAVAQYTRFQHMLGERTWLEDVKLLPPASLLRYRPDDDRLRIERYWDWQAIAEQPAISFGDAVAHSISLFERAVDAMIAPPQRVGVYLSGGLDSRTILGFIDNKVPVTTLTYGAPGCRDVVYAGRIARLAGSAHHWFPLVDGRWVLEYAQLHLQLTEGLHSWIHAHGISTLERARSLIDVNLSGWEGGVIFGGDTMPLLPGANDGGEPGLLQSVYQALCSRLTWPGLTEAEAEAVWTGRGDRSMRGLAWDSLREEWARSSHYSPEHRLDYVLLEQHHRRLTQNMLTTARSAIEVRCPFYDYSFVEFMFAIPTKYRANEKLRYAVLTQRLPRLTGVPYDWDNRLPHSNRVVRGTHATLERAKQRVNRHVWPLFRERSTLYADYEQWLRTDLRGWAEAILFDGRTIERGVWDEAAVRSLWERHVAGSELWTIGKLAPLMTAELALRELSDGEQSDAQPPGQAACAS